MADQELLVRDLQGTNDRLHFCLETLSQEPPKPASPEQIAQLLSELLRVGDWLRNRLPFERERGPALEQELVTYRRNVERLHNLLPSMHRELLSEKARLERQRSHMQSVAEWALVSRQTL